MKKLFITSLAAAAFVAVPAQAAPTIVNGGFDAGGAFSGFQTVGNGDTTTIQGWTVGGASVDYIGDYWQPQNGTNSIDLAGNGIGSIAQTLATDIGQLYQVTFWISRNPDGGMTPRSGFVDVGGASSPLSFGNAASTRANMLWERTTYRFAATTGSTTLRFSADPATSGQAFGLALDNVSITAVPEPATWAMMIMGFGLIGSALRRAKPKLTAAFA